MSYQRSHHTVFLELFNRYAEKFYPRILAVEIMPDRWIFHPIPL
ncbi:MAG: hypothetical protein ACFFBD_12590 [Candidatus Hodarchaeota archaeon]